MSELGLDKIINKPRYKRRVRNISVVSIVLLAVSVSALAWATDGFTTTAKIKNAVGIQTLEQKEAALEATRNHEARMKKIGYEGQAKVLAGVEKIALLNNGSGGGYTSVPRKTPTEIATAMKTIANAGIKIGKDKTDADRRNTNVKYYGEDKLKSGIQQMMRDQSQQNIAMEDERYYGVKIGDDWYDGTRDIDEDKAKVKRSNRKKDAKVDDYVNDLEWVGGELVGGRLALKAAKQGGFIVNPKTGQVVLSKSRIRKKESSWKNLGGLTASSYYLLYPGEVRIPGTDELRIAEARRRAKESGIRNSQKNANRASTKTSKAVGDLILEKIGL